MLNLNVIEPEWSLIAFVTMGMAQLCVDKKINALAKF